MAMARYAAKLFGIYPTDTLQVFCVDSVLGYGDEIINAVVGILVLIPNEVARAVKTTELKGDKVPQVFSHVQIR